MNIDIYYWEINYWENRWGMSTSCRRYCFIKSRFITGMKVTKLIRGMDNKVCGAELLVYDKNSEKTSKVKWPLR